MPYIGRSTEAFGVRSRFTYLASASDTSVSGADVNGLTLSFTDGAYVDVFLNGSKLDGTEYAATNGSSVSLTAAAAADDIVEIVAYETVGITSISSATQGLNVTGIITATTFSGDGSSLTGMASTDKVATATLNVSGISTLGGTIVGGITAMGANSVDCRLGNYFTKTITGATTFTFDNVPASGVAYGFTMEVTLNGSNAITWPGTVKWNADTAPTLTDGKTQLFMFVTNNGGTRWRGSALVDYVN